MMAFPEVWATAAHAIDVVVTAVAFVVSVCVVLAPAVSSPYST